MSDFEVSITIDAPADRTWEVMSDVDRWSEWTPSVSSARRLGNGPFAAGTRVLVKQPRFPPAVWTITEVEPGRSFTWVSRAPGLRAVARHRVEPVADGSRATLSLDYHGVVGRALARLTSDITRRYIALEASGLKARSEDPAFVAAR